MDFNELQVSLQQDFRGFDADAIGLPGLFSSLCLY